jgi:NAD(P)-dependent dehydrogenase (short-subunit alcohol dehydrogenase family)
LVTLVETEDMHAAGFAESDFCKQVEAQTPLGRISQPQDIAPAAVFLASADAAWISGGNTAHRQRLALTSAEGELRCRIACLAALS